MDAFRSCIGQTAGDGHVRCLAAEFHSFFARFVDFFQSHRLVSEPASRSSRDPADLAGI
jgi:hypothetical protein